MQSTQFAINSILWGIVLVLTIVVFQPTKAAYALDCDAAKSFLEQVKTTCANGNQDACQVLPNYEKNYLPCLHALEAQPKDTNKDKKKFGFVSVSQIGNTITTTESKRPYCLVENTWNEYVYDPKGPQDWSVDYLISRCSGLTAVILILENDSEYVHIINENQKIKHYRRSTNNVSYRWCPESEYIKNGDCDG